MEWQARIWDFIKAGVQSIWKGHRRSSTKDAESGEVWGGGCAPLPGKFFYFLCQNGEFLCIHRDIY